MSIRGLALLAVAACTASVPATPEPAPDGGAGDESDAASPGAVVAYHFDELSGTTFADAGPAHRDATCSGARCPHAGLPGLAGARRLAADFPAACMAAPATAALDLTSPTQPTTIAAWVNLRHAPAAGAAPVSILGKAGAFAIGLAFGTGSDRTAYPSFAAPGAGQVNAKAGITDADAWHLLAFRLASDGRHFQWWLDGALSRSGTLAAAGIPVGRAALQVGCIDGGAAAFDGGLDEVLISHDDPDLAALYAATRPRPAQIAYWGQQMRGSDGRANVALLAQELADRHATQYEYVVNSNQPSDYADLLAFLPLADARAIGTWIDFNAFESEAGGKRVEPYRTDHATWLAHLGSAAAPHASFRGFNVDDFFWGAGAAASSYATPATLAPICRAARAANVKLSATIYCGTKLSASAGSAALAGWDYLAGASRGDETQDQAMVDLAAYAHAHAATDPDSAAIDGCISHLDVWMYPVDYAAYAPHDADILPSGELQHCLANLRPLGVELMAGNYTYDHSQRTDITAAQRLANVAQVRRTNPDGMIFFINPVTTGTYDSTAFTTLTAYPDAATIRAGTGGYPGLDAIVAAPSEMIDWLGLEPHP